MMVNAPARILVWQWGRFGGAPRFGTLVARGLAELPGVEVTLSLSRGAEILREDPAQDDPVRGDATPRDRAPRCDLLVDTYTSLTGFVARALSAPFAVAGLARRIKKLRPDLAICAQPGPLDLLMAAALRWLRIPFVVLVHDADAHPGDGFPMQMWLQRVLCRRADAVAALTAHVGDRLRDQKLAGTRGRPLIRLRHPPMQYAFAPSHDRGEGLEGAPLGGTFHLLSFGRLLPYKGLDILAESLALLGQRPGLTIRVVGSGPESRELSVLRSLPGVTVENRWVPETEVGALFSWADAVVLPYREASQSGVAAVALAAHRYVIATNVGGLAEQLDSEKLAILCEPNAQSLANGLRRVLDEPSRVRQPAQIDTRMLDTMNGWRELGRSLLDQTMPLLTAQSGVRKGAKSGSRQNRRRAAAGEPLGADLEEADGASLSPGLEVR